LGFTVGIAVSGLTATKAPLFDIWPKEGTLEFFKRIQMSWEGTFTRHREMTRSHITLEDLHHASWICIFTSIFPHRLFKPVQSSV